MDNGDKKQTDQFNAALPLPIDDDSATPSQPQKNAAADLIRKKVEAAYSQEPWAGSETQDLQHLGKAIKRSKHQDFIYRLSSSGKPLHEIQVAWHEYYAGLSDDEKREVWNEFYRTHAEASRYTPAAQAKSEASFSPPSLRRTAQRLSRKPKPRQQERPAGRAKSPPSPNKRQPLHSLLFGLGVGTIVLVVFLFSFFNERFIAPFIQPSRSVSNTPIIDTKGAVGSEPEIIIPKINVQIPVVYTVDSIDEAAIDKGLESGVVRYPYTPSPGQNGNVVIVGHSSNNIFNPGKYKFAFVLLNRLENGDTFYLLKDGKRYTYQIYKKQIVGPAEVSVLGPADKPATATLITCDPPGTSINRLVVTAEQTTRSPTPSRSRISRVRLA